MDSTEDNLEAVTDDSRPSYLRPKCCVGIYLDVIDAVPGKDRQVGSRHAFMMSVTAAMLEHFLSLDLAKVKGALERRHVCGGVIVEGFRSGCVLAVTFDSTDALDSIWALHAENRLTPVSQSILVDRELLTATQTLKLTLRAKLWEDEYRACMEEIQARSPHRRLLRHFEHDLDMVERVKEHQKVMPDIIGKAKDAESKFEHGLGEFMLAVKRLLPGTVTAVGSIREFCADIEVARGTKKSEFQSVEQYLQTLEFFRMAFTLVEENIVHPLCQVRALCEKERQRKLKMTIKDACAEMLSKLNPEADLKKIRYKDWELKTLPREHDLFYGLISLVPMSLDRLTTIDLSTDEYIMDFPKMAV